MAERIIQIDSVDAYNKQYGWETLHPLVTVANHPNPMASDLNHSRLHLLVERKRHLAAVSLFGRLVNGKPHHSANEVLLQTIFTVTAYGGSDRQYFAEPILGCFTELVKIPFRTFHL